MQDKRIVLLAGEWDTTPVVYHFLQQHFVVEKVVIEDSVPKKDFLKRRIKNLGLVKVAGQVLFQLLIGKPLSLLSKARIAEILQEYGLKKEAIPSSKLIRVPSVNDAACLSALQQLQPHLVVVHGTRIISKKILQGVDAPFVNIHAGITPRYRGSHGGYWALVNNDREHCGVTVHLVDAGIDTGRILLQEKIPVTNRDNFATYGYLQLAVGLQLLKQAIEDVAEGKEATRDNSLNSALWHHPTLWGYLKMRIRRGVK